jgi:Ca-activated chloride channel family protein
MPNTNPALLITPLKSALLHGVAQKLPVLVRLQAPDADPAAQNARGAYHLSLVIDRSGSMSGEPLKEAVRCARHIVDRLQPTDVVSLVTFDDRVDVLVPAMPVGNRRALHATLARVHSGGSTNLHGGWKAGIESLKGGARDAALARVVLLSDGNANVGELTDTRAIAALCELAAANGVSTSTYGLGVSFNEDLMVEMAKRGRGNPYYGETAADLFEPFAAEFDLISNLYARNLRLSLSAPDGVAITLCNDYPVEERDGFRAICLPDLPFGAEAWVLLELEVGAGLALESGNQLLQAGITGATPEGIPITVADATLALKALTPPAWEAVLPDPLVLARIAEVEVGRMLEAARRAAEHGDWQTIRKMLDEARKRFADHPWVIEVLENMAGLAKSMDTERFRKEAMYSSRRMSTRLASPSESLSTMACESTAPSFLRRKAAQGKAQFEKRGKDGRT